MQHSNIRISMKSLFSEQFDTIDKETDDIKHPTSYSARPPTMDPNFNRGEALDIWRQRTTNDAQNDAPTIKPRNVLKASKTFESKKISVQPENSITLIPAAIGAQDDDFLFDTEE